jgi:hypothetical protein
MFEAGDRIVARRDAPGLLPGDIRVVAGDTYRIGRRLGSKHGDYLALEGDSPGRYLPLPWFSPAADPSAPAPLPQGERGERVAAS